MAKLKNKELVQIGDIIVITTAMGKRSHKITRVTKRMAMSICHSDGYEYRFNRVASHNMSLPRESNCFSNYSVFRNTEGSDNDNV